MKLLKPEDISRTVDGLGKPIDRGRRKEVELFNSKGYPTTASCEGHIRKKYFDLASYIDIEAPTPSVYQTI